MPSESPSSRKIAHRKISSEVKSSPILFFFRLVFAIYELLFVFLMMGKGRGKGCAKGLKNSVKTHLLCSSIRDILKFHDKTLPRRPFWKLKHEKTFVFRKTLTKRKQLYNIGAAAFRPVSKASFVCVFK